MGFRREEKDYVNDPGAKGINFYPEHAHGWLKAVMIVLNTKTHEIEVGIELEKGLDSETRDKKIGELKSLSALFSPKSQRDEKLGEIDRPKPARNAFLARLDEAVWGEIHFEAGPTSSIRDILTMTHIPRDIQVAVMDELQEKWRQIER